jgi:hypothetical protein
LKSMQDIASQYERILKRLKALANPESVAGMVRYGINPQLSSCLYGLTDRDYVTNRGSR